MDSRFIIFASVALNAGFVALAMFLVYKVKMDQRRRQQALVKMAKEKAELDQLNEVSAELLAEKDEVLDMYRELLKI